MRSTTFVAILAAFSSAAIAAKDSRTFAVNHFYGTPSPLTMGRMDPIVSPGTAAQHVHAVHGGSNFGLSMDNEILMDSNCTTSRIQKDNSNYWTPALFFQADNGSFISVDFYYMNVYYFFEPTDDEIKAFPVGLRLNIEPAAGDIQPVQWTCPRTSYDPPSYPADSDGLNGVGIGDPNNKGSGAGFPDQNCDGFASPLRADIHFPSCYNPKAGLRDYKSNTAFPSSKGTTGGKANCPEGWIHLPHIFYEVYWNTPAFKDEWTPGQGKQPFILANGDRTGYSLHGDFIAGWDTDTLQNIIDNCNGGDAGMESCSTDITGPQNDPATAQSCNVPNLVPEKISGVLDRLPGNNPPTGWGVNVDLSPSGVSLTLGGSGDSATETAAANLKQDSTPTAAASSPTSEPEPVEVIVTVTEFVARGEPTRFSNSTPSWTTRVAGAATTLGPY
ncbi:hypothetical protein N7470_004770 [Penicillium chermesinum]|nr:hypothetical protein N7470_004770 [Penicillium chermesinum]